MPGSSRNNHPLWESCGRREPPRSPSWDPRIGAWRAPAFYHVDLSRELARRLAGDVPDEVSPGLAVPPPFKCPELRPYQAAAMRSWEISGRRGIVALPTGSGKTRIAIAAIARTQLRALCLVPHAHSWRNGTQTLDEATPGPVGEYGDGRRMEQPITVATYASAARHMETLGNRFGLLVIDEVHHFGSGAETRSSRCVRPRRDSDERNPAGGWGSKARLEALVGPEVYRASVEELAGR